MPLSDVRCSVRLPARPRRVYLGGAAAAGRKDLPFAYEQGRVEVTVERLRVHEVVVIES